MSEKPLKNYTETLPVNFERVLWNGSLVDNFQNISNALDLYHTIEIKNVNNHNYSSTLSCP